MATPATKRDIQDLGSIIQGLATEVGQRFDGVDQRLDGIDKRFDGVDQRFATIADRLEKIEGELADLRTDFGRMLDLLDGFTKRLDDFMKEMLARDARVDRLERWVKLIAAKTGVKLTS